MSIAEQAEGSRDVGVAAAAANDFDVDRQIRIARYAGEQQMQTIMGLIDEELSEPYTVFTYRYFLNQWPQLCFLAHYHPVERAEKGDLHSSIWSTPSNDNSPRPIGVVIGKLDRHMKGARYLRGYIGMISVQPSFRGKGIATRLLHVVLREMVRQGAQEVRHPSQLRLLALRMCSPSLSFSPSIVGLCVRLFWKRKPTTWPRCVCTRAWASCVRSGYSTFTSTARTVSDWSWKSHARLGTANHPSRPRFHTPCRQA